MFYFICMGSGELCGTGRKQKRKSMSPPGIKPATLAFQAGTLENGDFISSNSFTNDSPAL